MNRQEVINLLRIHISDQYNGSQSDFADAHGMSPGYLCSTLKGRRLPGPKILSAIGLEKVVSYEKKKKLTNGSSR